MIIEVSSRVKLAKSKKFEEYKAKNYQRKLLKIKNIFSN